VSGAQLAWDLKTQDPAKPVVLLSGHIASVDAALAEMADAVLQKPISLARLLNTLERCLQAS
jgi:FixJ family two-component response regulator